MKDLEAGGYNGGGKKRGAMLAGLAALLFLVGAGVALAIALPLSLNKDSKTKVLQAPATLDADDKPVSSRYYLKANKIRWDYVPMGINNCVGGPFEGIDKTYAYGPPIGSNYTKAVFRQYTDNTFSEEMERGENETHLGILGPIIRGTEGDVIEVTVMNDLEFAINIEPSGVQYETPVALNPGDVAVYRWVVPDQVNIDRNSSSAMWLYRSSVDIVGHTSAGLTGPLILSRKGASADFDKEFVVLLQGIDETASPYWEDNLGKNNVSDLDDDQLQDVTMKFAMNGLLFCNLEGLRMNIGDRVRWYAASLGSENDLHSLHWHGITLLQDGNHRVDQVQLQAGTFYTLDSKPDSPGIWLIHCHVNEHLQQGMRSLFAVDGEVGQLDESGTNKTYYIGAVMEEWDFAPEGGSMCTGKKEPFNEDAQTFTEPGPDRIGTKYLKARYIEFTDATFTTRKNRTAEDEHLGVMGPTLRGTVGDTMNVVLKNMVPGHNISAHPHGVFYLKDSEGAPYNDGTSGKDKLDDAVPTNATVTYKWNVLERSAPGPGDPSSIMWMWHSHTDEVADTYAGLFAALVITRKGEATDEGRPQGIDREVVLTFMVMDENQGFLLDANFARYLKNVTSPAAIDKLKADADFVESNLKHSINGMFFCNLPGLEFDQGSTVRVYYMSLGTIVDLHTPTVMAGQLQKDGHVSQSIQLIGGGMQTTDLTTMNPGLYLLTCQINDHITAGMQATYRIVDKNMMQSAANSKERKHFIAADEVDWDYVPLKYNGCNQQDLNDDEKVYVFTTKTTVGSEYKKSVYRPYTDETFTKKADHPESYGLLGPMIVAEVGDTITVVFKNNVKGRSLSFAPHGGLRPLHDVDAGREIEPGKTFTYQWVVPENAGPGPNDGDSVAYIYFSDVDSIGDSYSGLMGVVVISTSGTLNDDGSNKNFDYVFPLFFSVMKEMESPYFDTNLAIQQKILGSKIDQEDPNFEESNLMHSINGYNYCNNPGGHQVAQGAKVRWVVFALGSETDMHFPVFSGQEIKSGARSVFGDPLMPSTAVMMDMTAQEQGAWNIYCFVLDHIAAGMETRLLVLPSQ